MGSYYHPTRRRTEKGMTCAISSAGSHYASAEAAEHRDRRRTVSLHIEKVTTRSRSGSTASEETARPRRSKPPRRDHAFSPKRAVCQFAVDARANLAHLTAFPAPRRDVSVGSTANVYTGVIILAFIPHPPHDIAVSSMKTFSIPLADRRRR